MMALERLALWLGFVVAMALVLTLFTCSNITPVRMAERGQCWDEASLVYRPCGQMERGR